MLGLVYCACLYSESTVYLFHARAKANCVTTCCLQKWLAAISWANCIAEKLALQLWKLSIQELPSQSCAMLKWLYLSARTDSKCSLSLHKRQLWRFENFSTATDWMKSCLACQLFDWHCPANKFCFHWNAFQACEVQRTVLAWSIDGRQHTHMPGYSGFRLASFSEGHRALY